MQRSSGSAEKRQSTVYYVRLFRPMKESRIMPRARWTVALMLSAFVVQILCCSASSQTNPNAPTVSADPNQIDEIWQNESSKYDAARSAILQRVDEVNAK